MQVTICYANDLVFLDDPTLELKAYFQQHQLIPTDEAELADSLNRTTMKGDGSGFYLTARDVSIRLSCANEAQRQLAIAICQRRAEIEVGFAERCNFAPDPATSYESHPGHSVAQLLKHWQSLAVRAAQ